jgi:tripartite-type tricarboxylate transporter receptor subunit TctC
MKRIKNAAKFFGCSVISAAATYLALPSASAQTTFADRPIRVVVPYPAGGTTDLLARAVSGRLGESLGRTVVVDNKPGAGGVIGSQQVAKSTPDGHTLVFASIASHGIIPALQTPPPYDAVKDFMPITLVASTPNVLLVNVNLPVKNVQELIALAKAKPGTINFGSTSHGGSPHMTGELLKTMAGIDIVHVPYKGGSPMLIDLIGGQVAMGFDNLPSSMANIRAGKVRALAVTTTTRWPGAPEIPTMSEAGVTGFDVSAWFGLLAPAATPIAIQEKLNAAVNKIILNKDVKERLLALGMESPQLNLEAFNKVFVADRDLMTRIVKETGITRDS